MLWRFNCSDSWHLRPLGPQPEMCVGAALDLSQRALKRIVQHNRIDSAKEQWSNTEPLWLLEFLSSASFPCPVADDVAFFWIASQTIQFRKSARQKGADAQADCFCQKVASLSGPVVEARWSKSWRFVESGTKSLLKIWAQQISPRLASH